MRQNTGFTLVEVLVAVALTGMILLTGYSTFQRIIQAQGRLGATIDVQKNLFYTNEKMAAFIRDGGTIDYEEYFNRRMMGYDRTMVNGLFTFTNLSHFGNGNINSKPPIYFCGIGNPPLEEEDCLKANAVFDSTSLPYSSASKTTIPITAPPPVDTIGHQPYGQYSALAYNYLDPVGYPMPIKLPPIFKTNDTIKIATRDVTGNVTLEDKNITNVGLPELYLIKKNLDNTYTRTYFRHIYVQDSFPGALSCNPATSLEGCLGKIQMTKLEGCDTVGTADGIIDAWIPLPEFAIGAVICPREASNIYKSAHEDTVGGEVANLQWVDVTSPDMNVIRATFLPNPLKIPALMSGSGDSAQSPSVSVYLEVQLSTRLRNKSFVREDMNYPRTLITSYDLSE